MKRVRGIIYKFQARDYKLAFIIWRIKNESKRDKNRGERLL